MPAKSPRTSESRSYRFDINPVAAARPRVGRWGTYYPKTYAGFKAEFQTLAKSVLGDVTAYTVPLSIGVEFHFRRPKKPSKPYPRPDIDNVLKSVMDGLNGLLWTDDSIITDSDKLKKRWAPPGEEGYIVVEVRPVDLEENV